MRRYRWIREGKQYKYVGRHNRDLRGKVCVAIIVPAPGRGAPGNILVGFYKTGEVAAVPTGTLRRI